MVAINSQPLRPLFPLGHIVATPGAMEVLARSGQRPEIFLVQHVTGNWGEVCDEDKKLNDAAVIEGTRILSAYETTAAERIWVITEADRSATTMLLPDEY